MVIPFVIRMRECKKEVREWRKKERAMGDF
jgi:hypothetical protein